LEKEKDRVWFPLGLLIEKWLLFYYPIFAYSNFIPQKPSERDIGEPGYKISFREQFYKITSYYEEKGGFSAFYNDYKKGQIPNEINGQVLDLVKKLGRTITRYPMKHLGYSSKKEHYSIFDFTKRDRIKLQPVTPELVIEKFGKFSINQAYFEIFNIFGGFISGNYSVLNKWAEFTVNSDRTGKLNQSDVMQILTTQPTTERDVKDVSQIIDSVLNESGYVKCVWSGKRIRVNSDIHIDHVIPFSVWSNNDLWNLLPSHRETNLKKRDYLPSPDLIKDRHDIIIDYWKKYRSDYPERFDSEIKRSLLGKSADPKDILNIALEKLMGKVDYLIQTYGYIEWK